MSLRTALYILLLRREKRKPFRSVIVFFHPSSLRYPGYNPWATKQATDDTIGYRVPAYPHNPYVLPPGYNSPDIICHNGATPGNLWVEVDAGGDITLQWTDWPISHKGDVVSYLAPVGDVDFKDVKKETLGWHKFQEDGMHTQPPSNSKAGEWASDTFIADGSKITLQIPSYVAKGKYVLRNEQIALHGANPHGGGAQNYPQCINILVTGGSGTDDLSSGGTLGTDLYKPSDSGVNVNLYLPIKNYVIPGPALYNGGGQGGGKVTPSPTTFLASASPSASSLPPASALPSSTALATTNVTKPDGSATGSPSYSRTPTFSNATATAQASPTVAPFQGSNSKHTAEGTDQAQPVSHVSTPSDSNKHADHHKDGSGKPTVHQDVSTPQNDNTTPHQLESTTQHNQPITSQDKSTTQNDTTEKCSKLNIPNDASVDELWTALDKVDALLRQKLSGKKHRRHARHVPAVH